MREGGKGGWGESQWRDWRLPAFPTEAFVVTHWWLWEPPSLCKSMFASQVFVCVPCAVKHTCQLLYI